MTVDWFSQKNINKNTHPTLSESDKKRLIKEYAGDANEVLIKKIIASVEKALKNRST